MKMRFKLTLIIIVSAFIYQGCTKSDGRTGWSFQTGGPIYSHPILGNETLYFGSSDYTFYALDANNGDSIWSIATTGPVQSGAIIHTDGIYFNNTNRVYALDKNSGEELWSYSFAPDSIIEALDPWDYHHGAPVVVNATIYFGLADGNLYGFDRHSGKIVDQFTTDDSAVIRCIPAVAENTIYFGDWNGVVYAYDTKDQDTLWTYATYAIREYDTFGQLNAGFIVYDSLLVFGGRNPRLQVLNAHTGKPVWNYVSEDGGWISGDPIVYQDTLYIGGSDNHKLFAFDIHTGSLIWEYEFLFNNFCKPVLVGDQLLFTTGDAGTAYRTDDGYGYLYSIDRFQGELRNVAFFDGNVFSTPVLDERSIYVADVTGKIYALDRQRFLSHPGDLSKNGYGSIDLAEPPFKSFQDSLEISYRVNYQSKIEFGLFSLEGQMVKQISNIVASSGDHTLTWDGRNENGDPAAPGYYYYELKVNEFIQSAYAQKLSGENNQDL